VIPYQYSMHLFQLQMFLIPCLIPILVSVPAQEFPDYHIDFRPAYPAPKSPNPALHLTLTLSLCSSCIRKYWLCFSGRTLSSISLFFSVIHISILDHILCIYLYICQYSQLDCEVELLVKGYEYLEDKNIAELPSLEVISIYTLIRL
jgi:hypothetical protein